MARVQIELPEQFVFTTELPVFISHINYAGHLDNALLLTLVTEARLRFFQAFHGEVMVVDMAPADIHGKGFDLVYRLRDKASGREVARGKSGLLCFDYAARQVVALPEGFLQRLTAA